MLGQNMKNWGGITGCETCFSLGWQFVLRPERLQRALMDTIVQAVKTITVETASSLKCEIPIYFR